MDDRAKAIQDSAAYAIADSRDYSWNDALEQAKLSAMTHRPAIIYGPPGTGKTKLLYELKKYLEESGKLGNFQVVQFHRKFSYEDFIEGYSPTGEGTFVKKDGVFKHFVRNNSDAEVDLFVIDEINRAEITTTFGELMFLIEDRGERTVTTSHFADQLTIPDNLAIIGTMNTADRNIANLDFALRRRFRFIPLFPDYTIMRDWLNQRGFEFKNFNVDDYVRAARLINDRISNNRLMGRNMQLGHAMWVPKGFEIITTNSILELFQFEIIPQLEAYLGFGNENQLGEMLNSDIASRYLNQSKIQFESVVGLVQDLVNEKR